MLQMIDDLARSVINFYLHLCYDEMCVFPVRLAGIRTLILSYNCIRDLNDCPRLIVLWISTIAYGR